MKRKSLREKRIERKLRSECKKLLSALKLKSCSVFRLDRTHENVAELIIREPFNGNGFDSIVDFKEIKIVKKVIQKKKPLCVKNPGNKEVALVGVDLHEYAGNDRILIIPLLNKIDHVTGLLVVDATNRDRLSKKDVRLSVSISDSISQLLARKRILDRLGAYPNLHTILGMDLFKFLDERRYRTL